MALQPQNFTAGRRPVVFHIGRIRLGDVICYEVGFDPLVSSEVRAGANLLTVQTNDATFEVDGNFTIRGVTRPEKLTLTVSGQGTGSGTIVGTMAFDRKDYGMNSGIPFIRIADRVEVSVNLKVKRVSGPPLAFKPQG